MSLGSVLLVSSFNCHFKAFRISDPVINFKFSVFYSLSFAFQFCRANILVSCNVTYPLKGFLSYV
uniref:Uncharacterized protein n=1 Tax=Rhizophora mucronata TaxID=61149 RepID=A0A2P2N9L6_RHIMU